MAYKDKAEIIKYNNGYNARAYDRINLTVPKGDKENIKARADKLGESINAYINRLIKEDMERKNAPERN